MADSHKTEFEKFILQKFPPDSKRGPAEFSTKHLGIK